MKDLVNKHPRDLYGPYLDISLRHAKDSTSARAMRTKPPWTHRQQGPSDGSVAARQREGDSPLGQPLQRSRCRLRWQAEALQTLQTQLEQEQSAASADCEPESWSSGMGRWIPLIGSPSGQRGRGLVYGETLCATLCEASSGLPQRHGHGWSHRRASLMLKR